MRSGRARPNTERITRQLIGVLNYLAAPFGTQEQMLLSFGLAGTDDNVDANGNPAATSDGFAIKPMPWRFLTQYLNVLNNAVNSSEFAAITRAHEQAMLAPAIQDPTLTLYSPTCASRNANSRTDLLLCMTDIVVGRRPMSE